MTDGLLTPVRRNALLGLFALALVAAPLWAPTLHLGGPTYSYERIEVVVDGDEIAVADENDSLGFEPLIEGIACTGYDVRRCALETRVAENETVPTEVYRSNPDMTTAPGRERYRYAQVDGRLYETSYETNRSARNDRGWYRVDLALKPADPEEALERVSVDPESPRDDVSPAVAEAARTGHATAREEVDVPETPVKTDDGYYRVYPAERSDGSALHGLLEWPLTYGSPLVGLYLLVGVRRRIEITYVGDGD